MANTYVVRVALGVHLLVGVLFLTTFRENLHCTQDTSFRIAAFEMTPHPEEEGPPLVYGGPLAIVLRTYFGVALLAFVLWPSVGALAVMQQRLSRTRWRVSVAVLTLLILVNAITPNAISGERFSALNAFALVIMMVPLAVLVYALRTRKERAET